MVWYSNVSQPFGGACKPLIALSRELIGLRASPRLLVAICVCQAIVLVAGLWLQVDRVDCIVQLPEVGPMVIDCDSCHKLGLTWRTFCTFVLGFGVISIGLVAVWRRDQRLLFIYGTCMLLFAFVVGLTAVLTALETPVLEVAVEGITEDVSCLDMAHAMMVGARSHAVVAAVGCIFDATGAVLAIRSKELFAYEDIAEQHNEAARIPRL
jgi:hypothetical protein